MNRLLERDDSRKHSVLSALPHPLQPETTFHPNYHIAPLSNSSSYLSRHLNTTQQVEENVLRWSLAKNVVNKRLENSIENEQKQFLKKVELLECFDWHQVERDVMQLLFEKNVALERKEQELNPIIDSKYKEKNILKEQYTKLLKETQELEIKNQHSSTTSYLWKQVELENKYLQTWNQDVENLQNELQEYQKHCQSLVESIQALTLSHYDTLQNMKKEFDEKVENEINSKRILDEQAELKKLIQEEKIQNETLSHLLEKKENKVKQLQKEISKLTDDCTVLTNTLATCKYFDDNPLDNYIPPKQKKKLARETDGLIRTKIRMFFKPCPKFRPRYHNELLEDYEFERDISEWIYDHMIPFEHFIPLRESTILNNSNINKSNNINNVFTTNNTSNTYITNYTNNIDYANTNSNIIDQLSSDSNSSYSESIALQRKRRYLKSYFLFRGQRDDESLSSYYQARRKFYEYLFKEPFRPSVPSESESHYAASKKKYENEIYYTFREKYILEDENDYNLKKNLHERRINWMKFRDPLPSEDKESYLQNKIEYLKSFSFRKKYPLELMENYLVSKLNHEKKFVEMKDELMENLTEVQKNSIINHVCNKKISRQQSIISNDDKSTNSRSIGAKQERSQSMLSKIDYSKVKSLEELKKICIPPLKDLLLLEYSEVYPQQLVKKRQNYQYNSLNQFNENS